MSTPESHPEKFPPAEPVLLPPDELERLEKLAAPLPDAPLPEDREARRKMVEDMFKEAMACFFGAPSPKTASEFEAEIDQHNAGVKQINEPQKPSSESKE